MNWIDKLGVEDIYINDKKRPVLIAGPCVIESKEQVFYIAETLKKICEKLEIPYIFKASYDKANRTSHLSFRGVGIDKGLEILSEVKNKYNIPIISDVHNLDEVDPAAEILDIIQIPAFLCRQTDLIIKAAKTGKVINIKKGQFVAPEDMGKVVEKVREQGNNKVLLTERGTFFGYQNLVNDFRGLRIMGKFAPVLYDATHSVQMPGGKGDYSGGDRSFIPILTRAAIAAGIYGIFMEIHPNPDEALSDRHTQFPLDSAEEFLTECIKLYELVETFQKWDLN